MSSDAEMTDVTSVTDMDSVSRKSSDNSSVASGPASLPPQAPSAAAANAAAATEGNNNSLPKEISYAELELLKKLEEQNR